MDDMTKRAAWIVVTAIEIGIEADADMQTGEPEGSPVCEEHRAFQARQEAVLALVRRFGLRGVLETLQFAAEEGRAIHSDPGADRETRGACVRLQAFSDAIAIACTKIDDGTSTPPPAPPVEKPATFTAELATPVQS